MRAREKERTIWIHGRFNIRAHISISIYEFSPGRHRSCSLLRSDLLFPADLLIRETTTNVSMDSTRVLLMLLSLIKRKILVVLGDRQLCKILTKLATCSDNWRGWPCRWRICRWIRPRRRGCVWARYHLVFVI